MKFFKSITAVFLVVYYLAVSVSAGSKSAEENVKYQQERMAYLENEFYKDYTPCDESKIAAFDIDEAIENGVKFNEVQFVATHNSYQLLPTDEYKQLFNTVSDLTFGLLSAEKTQFEMDNLTEQFELGIRSVEVDIETVDDGENVSFIVTHDPLCDNTSSCYDFEKALEEIRMWSDNNPGHLPITVIIEPKKAVVPVNNMKNFTLEYARILDELIREKMGDKLLTPKDMMRDFADFKEMRENDGWLTLEETMGKVLFLLHDTTVTSKYISLDKTIKSQAMFPMLRYNDRDKSYASFIIDNSPADALKHKEESLGRCNLIVRTRADSFPAFSDEKYKNADESLSQIISTDFPVRKYQGRYHEYTFDGYMVKLQK